MTSIVLRLSDLTDEYDRLAVPTEDVIVDAIRGDFRDLWRLVDCPLARMRIEMAWAQERDSTYEDVEQRAGAVIDECQAVSDEQHAAEIAVWEQRVKVLTDLLAKAKGGKS
jgi:hypothetical protein